jgi:FO synthase
VPAIAREGAALGCKEVMFTLGDKPGDRSRQAREWLDAHGYDDTLSYVRATVIRVLEETGLLTPLNPGVTSWQDLQRLKPVVSSHGHDARNHGGHPPIRRQRPHFTY